MNLVLATDGAPDTTAALAAAARVFRHEDLEAELLCVVPEFHAPEGADPHARRLMDQAEHAYKDRMIREAERILAVGLETLRSEGLAGRPQTDFGSPADVILRRSTDVTVVGANDRFGRTQPELPWLRFGLEEEWLAEGADDPSAAAEVIRHEAGLVVERARAELERAGIVSEPVLGEGLPEVQILSEADVGEYDLVVLGATGKSDLANTTIGGVAIRVAENAPATVWVVR